MNNERLIITADLDLTDRCMWFYFSGADDADSERETEQAYVLFRDATEPVVEAVQIRDQEKVAIVLDWLHVAIANALGVEYSDNYFAIPFRERADSDVSAI